MNEHEKVLLKVKRPRGGDFPLPEYQTSGAACFDLSADLMASGLDSYTILPGREAWFRTGWCFEVPAGFEMQIRGRSGLAYNDGVVAFHIGTIDCDYRGEVMVALVNHGEVPFTVTHGMRIAQAKIERVEPVSIIEVDELSETKRGTNGFGSTGSEP